jgi:hypothetical protein
VFRIVNVGALAEGEVQEHLREGRPASQLTSRTSSTGDDGSWSQCDCL